MLTIDDASVVFEVIKPFRLNIQKWQMKSLFMSKRAYNSINNKKILKLAIKLSVNAFLSQNLLNQWTY